MTTRVSSGGVTVEVGGELAEFVADLVARTETAALREIREAAAEVAAHANREWYRMVTRRTGRTGQIAVQETVDVSQGEVRVSVGSRDRRVLGRPVPLYVREPGRTSTIEVVVDRARWEAAPEALRVPLGSDGVAPIYRIRQANPKSGTGRYLVPTLITGPMRARAKAIGVEIARRAARGK